MTYSCSFFLVMNIFGAIVGHRVHGRTGCTGEWPFAGERSPTMICFVEDISCLFDEMSPRKKTGSFLLLNILVII